MTLLNPRLWQIALIVSLFSQTLAMAGAPVPGPATDSRLAELSPMPNILSEDKKVLHGGVVKGKASNARLRSAALKPAVKSVTVPADTVLYVKLSETLASNQSRQGESVTATVTDPVYVGPFLVIPQDSTITGTITEVCKTKVKKGPNPYIVVDFYGLQRPGEHSSLPFAGTLIAYKTGLHRKDYVWRLPQKRDKLRANLTSMVEGAAYGLMVNPIFGTPIGAGVGLLKSVAINKVSEKGAIKIKPEEEIPISVGQAFRLPVAGNS